MGSLTRPYVIRLRLACELLSTLLGGWSKMTIAESTHRLTGHLAWRWALAGGFPTTL